MFNLAVKVIRVTVVHNQDISIEFEGPSPYPELEAAAPGEYSPHFKVICRRGYARSWLEAMQVPMDIVEFIA